MNIDIQDTWTRRALHHVAKARRRKFPVSDRDFERLIGGMTPNDALYVFWVTKNQKIPAGCLVRTCENEECANPEHAEERP